MQEKSNSLNEYYSTLDKAQLEEMERVKRAIILLQPDVEEVLSYGIPTVKYRGKTILHFAAFKDHYSVFPGSGPIKELAKELKDFETSKGTIKYKADNLLPVSIINKLVQIRLAEIE